MKPNPQIQVFRDRVIDLGGKKKAADYYGYSFHTIHAYLYRSRFIPMDVAMDLNVDYPYDEGNSMVEELMKYILYVGGKKEAARRLQCKMDHMNKMISPLITANRIPPIIAERAELDSDGYVSKVKMVFAAPSVYRGDDQPVRKLGDPIRCPS